MIKALELVAADRVKDYLKYSDRAGNEMIDDAVQLAQVRYFQIELSRCATACQGCGAAT